MARFSKDGDKNKQIEAATAEIVGKIWNVKFNSYPSLNPIDYWCERNGRILYHAEIKGRNHASDEHETIMFAMKKWMHLLVSVYHMDIPACILFHLLDGIYVIDALKISPETKKGVGGRRFSRYSNRDEREPVVYIPMNDLKLVTKETWYSQQGLDYHEMMGI